MTLRFRQQLLHLPYVARPSRLALRLPIPARLFSPWKLTEEGELRLFLAVLNLLLPYDRSLLLEVPLTPLLGLLPNLMLPSAFCTQLEPLGSCTCCAFRKSIAFWGAPSVSAPVSGWVRAADPSSVKVSQHGSRGGTAAELRRARDELYQAEARRGTFRRKLDAMVGRVAQLTEQLCEYSERGQLGKRRRDGYAPPRDDDYDRSRGRNVYGPARGHADCQNSRYGDRVMPLPGS